MRKRRWTEKVSRGQVNGKRYGTDDERVSGQTPAVAASEHLREKDRGWQAEEGSMISETDQLDLLWTGRQEGMGGATFCTVQTLCKEEQCWEGLIYHVEMKAR